MRGAPVAGVLAAVFVLASCGESGETTTVIREVAAPPAESNAAEPAVSRGASEPLSTSQGKPPNVLGLPLPEAQRMLREAGYRTAPKNTDTTFGIIVPENYTICRQGKPRGDLVVVLAQKYGC